MAATDEACERKPRFQKTGFLSPDMEASFPHLQCAALRWFGRSQSAKQWVSPASVHSERRTQDGR